MFEDLDDNEDAYKKQAKLFEQKKKYRNLESDKKTYIEESVKVIKKQKTTIEKLKKQNEALKDLLAKMNREENQQGRAVISESKLQTIEELNNAISEERESQKMIEANVINFQKKITEKKKNCMGMNSGAENEHNMQKQIKILENRLDKANQKFNETTASNKELKNVIDSFRRERVIFDNLYKKLEKELHEKRKKMADIIERANNAYEDRDKAHNQIQALKMQAKKEASEFEKEIKEITYLMEKIKLTSYARKTEQLNEVAAPSNFYETEPVGPAHSLKPFKKNNEQNEKVQKFREDFAKIEAATEIENFDELLRIFTENEEKNFQMFKFVNLQSNEIEQLEAEVFELNNELQKAKNDFSSQEAKQHYVSSLEASLAAMKRSLDDTQELYINNQAEIRPLVVYIERIFDTIECDRDVAKELAGNKAITENNLLVFLAIVEHKSIQIINTFKQLSNPNFLTNTNKQTHPNFGMLTFDDFQDKEEYNKILTADELREKAKDFIEREQQQKQKKKDLRQKKK